MRVFLHDLNGYIGRILLEKLIDEGHEVVGTVTCQEEIEVYEKRLSTPLEVSDTEENPNPPNRVVLPNDKSNLNDLLISSEVIIYPLIHSYKDVIHALDILRESTSNEDKLFIGISSILTWGKCAVKQNPNEFYVEDDFKQRKPSSSYQEYKTLETQILSTQKLGLKTLVIGAGILYGKESNSLHFLLREAWMLQKHALPIPSMNVLPSAGENVVPFIHVQDLATIVIGVLENPPSKQYMLAIDRSHVTLRELTQTISTHLGTGSIQEINAEEWSEMLLDNPELASLQLNLRFDLSKSVIEELGISDQLVYSNGIVANMKKVVDEFLVSLDLRPIRVVLHGPPSVGKTTLAQSLSKKYFLPFISATNSLQKLKDEGCDRLQEILDLPSDSSLSTSLMEKLIQWRLAFPDCRNQGYVLDGFPVTHEEAFFLFSKSQTSLKDDENDDDENDDNENENDNDNEEETREKDDLKSLPSLSMPTHVVVLDANDEFLEKRAIDASNNNTEGSTSSLSLEEEFNKKLKHYREHSDVNAITFFEVEGKLEVLEIQVDQLQDKVEDILSRYLENGKKPFNFHPTKEERIARKIEEDQQKEKEEAERIRQQEQIMKKERILKEERENREKLRLEFIQKEEKELLEARSMPLRRYLMETVIPALTEGMLEVVERQPEDPIDYLAEFLFKKGRELEDQQVSKMHQRE